MTTLFEIHALFVGASRVGKRSLLNQICGPNPNVTRHPDIFDANIYETRLATRHKNNNSYFIDCKFYHLSIHYDPHLRDFHWKLQLMINNLHTCVILIHDTNTQYLNDIQSYIDTIYSVLKSSDKLWLIQNNNKFNQQLYQNKNQNIKKLISKTETQTKKESKKINRKSKSNCTNNNLKNNKNNKNNSDKLFVQIPTNLNIFILLTQDTSHNWFSKRFKNPTNVQMINKIENLINAWKKVNEKDARVENIHFQVMDDSKELMNDITKLCQKDRKKIHSMLDNEIDFFYKDTSLVRVWNRVVSLSFLFVILISCCIWQK